METIVDAVNRIRLVLCEANLPEQKGGFSDLRAALDSNSVSRFNN